MRVNNVKTVAEAKGLLVLPFEAGKKVSKELKKFDTLLGFSLEAEIKRRGFHSKAGSTLLIHTPQLKKIVGLLVLAWDKKPQDTYEACSQYRKLGAVAAKDAARLHTTNVAIQATGLELQKEDFATALLEGFALAQYKFNRYKSGNRKPKAALTLQLISSKPQVKAQTIARARVLVEATCVGRDLINIPAADCNPAFLADFARSVARKGKLKFQLFDHKKLKKMGANALLAVGRASAVPPRLAKITYKPKGRSRKVISLVGKGITFDTGGLCIKTYAGMTTMKCDMGGAAAVIAAMQALAILKPSVEVRAYIPIAENMIDGTAMRPGDVLRAMNGKTIEMLNTDAEGRLILADALTLASRDKADVIVDLATLTGAAVVALGNDYAALYSKDEKLSSVIMAAGAVTGERFWPMPLAAEYESQIGSSVADIRNIGGSYGGSITAALFLQHFVKDARWAHLDIAGPAFTEGSSDFISKGGVGFAVRTMVRMVEDLQ